MNTNDIIELLRTNFGEDTNWNNIVSEIADGYESKNGKKEGFWEEYDNSREQFYRKMIPNHLRVLDNLNVFMNSKRSKTEIVNPGVYDYGIYLIGFSEDPTILSLAFMRPCNIHFICTEESEMMIGYIKEALGYFDKEMQERIERALQNGHKTKLRNSSDPAETFKTIKNVVQSIREKDSKCKIMVDITGGKKTMVSGAFNSTSLFKDIDILYVDFGSYDEEKRKPKYCTEFISKLQNPNNIYRYTDLERIKGLFDSHRYDITSKDIEVQLKVMDRYGDEYYGNEKIKLRELKKWTDIYNDWDQYRYSVFSVDSNSEDIKKLHGLNEQDRLLLKNVANKLDLSEEKNPSYILQKVFEDIIEKNNIEYYDKVFSFVAVDRYCNAERRKKTDNEGCIIRLCSIIELLTYYYLIKNHRCLSINGNQQVSSNEIIKAVYGNYSSESGGHKQLGLNLYKRIKLVTGTISSNDKINVKWKDEKCKNEMTFNDESAGRIIEEINDKRNESSITHSIGFIGNEKIDEYMQKTKEFIEWVFSMEKGEFEELEKKIAFRKAVDLGF